MTPEMETPTDEELFHVQLREPHLLNSSNAECEAFRKMLKENFTLTTKQSLNAGLEALTSEDIANINKIANARDSQRTINRTKIRDRNRERSEKIMQQNQELISFDFDQDLMPYGKEFQRKVASIEYKPSFAHLIHDFNTISRCLACHSFPKVSSSGLCHACNFYLKHNMHNRFPDKSFQLPNQSSSPDNSPSLTSLITPLITEFFRYLGYRECQRESIISFVEGKDTMILLPTGGGKTLCYSASALLCEGLTVVFSPLKALIDDQVIEVTKMGIPCAGLYTSIGQPASYQKKVFEELSFGFIKILFVTPEKFDKNIGFQKMLYRIYERFGLHFVIDEAHCVKEYKYLGNLIQEVGRAGRDRVESKSVLFFSRNDIRSVYGIVTSGRESSIQKLSDFQYTTNFDEIGEKIQVNYLLDKQRDIFNVIYYCEELYVCRQVILNGYYSWPKDKPAPSCKKCDNCIRFAKDKPSLYDISSDVLRMLEVVDAVVDFLKRKQKDNTRDDIIGVFCQANNKNIKEKGLSELMIYKTTNNKTIKRQNDALHLLDQLIINGLVLSDIVLRKLPNLSNFHCYIAIIGLKEDSIAEAMSKKWQTLLKN
ncbi:11937_t:CDS:2 [Entrophospora sp. SA101]|nr:11937_t:CDS:2 [Entrophospora sp. SA101]